MERSVKITRWVSQHNPTSNCHVVSEKTLGFPGDTKYLRVDFGTSLCDHLGVSQP